MRVRGHKNGGILHASFNGKIKSEFKDSRDMPLSNTKSLILISIQGNKQCDGLFLEATIQEALLTPHRWVTFLIADEIYWHNLKEKEENTDEEIATLKAEAEKLGSEFFERNLPSFLKPLNITNDEFQQNYSHLTTSEKIQRLNRKAKKRSLGFEIVRWSDWIAQPSYQENYVNLQKLYATNPTLLQSIEEAVTGFATRHQEDGGLELWQIRSRGYLIEETPAIIWLSIVLNYNFIIYPGKMPKPFLETKNYLLANQEDLFEDELKNKLNKKFVANWLEVHFKKQNVKASIKDSVTTSPTACQLPQQPREQLSSSQHRALLNSAPFNPYAFFSNLKTEDNSNTTFSADVSSIVHGFTSAILNNAGTVEDKSELFKQFLLIFLKVSNDCELENKASPELKVEENKGDASAKKHYPM